VDSAPRQRVAFFGGSFNPPHVAHVLAVVAAQSLAAIDRVLVVPVYRHPFSKELVSFEHRLAMCELALGWLPNVEVSAVERDLGGESLTLRTLEHLAEANPSWSLRLLVGSDVVRDFPKWHRFDRVAELAPPLFLGRVGHEHPDVPAPVLPGFSSSEVRDALARSDARYVGDRVPAKVLEYIDAHGLYRR
jgi:nicotinate-nucleotide adenylyltransferase